LKRVGFFRLARLANARGRGAIPTRQKYFQKECLFSMIYERLARLAGLARQPEHRDPHGCRGG